MTRRPPPRLLPIVSVAAVLWAVTAAGQPSPVDPAVAAARERLAAATREDHADMLRQLGITTLRPGPSGNPSAPDAANSDESRAMGFATLPDPLVRFDGRRVAGAAAWRARRRELLDAFAREMYGRVPVAVPRVTWREVRRVSTTLAGRPVRGREVVGIVDNRTAPTISVRIPLMLVTPADATGPVPVMILFRGGGLPGDPPPVLPPGFRPPPPRPGDAPPAPEQLIAAGWGYAFLNPTTVQADNGAGLTSGIIGLVNRGARRRPEDWGALRAWAWGASRALDYLATDAAVDASRVGIDGVSRYGKAALLTMATDHRFAVALVASAGAGGTKILRRDFGEAIENLTGSGEYHWFAGRFLRYGAEVAREGRRDARDLPVDAHLLIALCAPRPVFVSHGVPAQGDAHWIDQRGGWMATLAAHPVYALLGMANPALTGDWRTTPMPAVNASLLDGPLAWRQHDGGHTDGPNWQHFIPWATRQLADAQQRVGREGPAAGRATAASPGAGDSARRRR